MGKHDFRKLRVRDAATLLMQTTRTSGRPPPWYATLTEYPPSQALPRPPAVQQRERPHRLRKYKKPSKMFMPQVITYDEDKLRTEFFKDHPWELARPRILVENDGRDGQRWDWSLEYQEGRPVDGESVIQRQHALMTPTRSNSEPLTRPAAYDKARKEMYTRRAFDEMETRIAREEAQAVGAYFGATATDVGMMLENKEFDRFRGWAKQQVTLQEQARAAAYAGSGVEQGQEATARDSLNALVDGEPGTGEAALEEAVAPPLEEEGAADMPTGAAQGEPVMARQRPQPRR